MCHASNTPMSGPAPDPSLPANSGYPAPDSAPWTDTDLGQAPGAYGGGATATVAPRPKKATVATDQLSTIGFIGRYALKYQIGEGGLGRVYAAHDPLLSRLIAIKTLNVEVSAEERDSFNALFLNEARAAGGLSHPHIVTVFDAGVSDQGPYIAMELLRGRDLRQLRLEGWRPTPTQAALLIRRVSDALGYAHSKGVVHRDIKPANIFMVGRTQPRVLDFGIARVAHHHDGPTDGDIIGGSPYYMAPEQVRQAPVDKRCDVFSLGVVLYELLTDVRPFRGSSLAEITGAVLEHKPPLAHEVDPNVPKALSEIAARAMEKNPEDRYSSARSLSRELRHWLDEHAQQETDEPPPAGPRRKWLWGASAGTAAALLAAGAAWWAWAPSASSPEGTAGTAQAASAAHEVASASSSPNNPALGLTPGVTLAAAAPPVAEAASSPAIAASAAIPETLPPAVEAAASAGAVAAPVAEPPPATAAPVAATAAEHPAAPPSPKLAAEVAAAFTKPPATPKETPKERRAREAREQREARQAAAASTAPVAAAMGTVRVAVSPWGQIEVDGKPAGIAPPLNELNLSEGRHTITIRNDEFPPFSATVNVTAGQPVNLKHRFGS